MFGAFFKKFDGSQEKRKELARFQFYTFLGWSIMVTVLLANAPTELVPALRIILLALIVVNIVQYFVVISHYKPL